VQSVRQGRVSLDFGLAQWVGKYRRLIGCGRHGPLRLTFPYNVDCAVPSTNVAFCFVSPRQGAESGCQVLQDTILSLAVRIFRFRFSAIKRSSFPSVVLGSQPARVACLLVRGESKAHSCFGKKIPTRIQHLHGAAGDRLAVTFVVTFLRESVRHRIRPTRTLGQPSAFQTASIRDRPSLLQEPDEKQTFPPGFFGADFPVP